jgi:hypothetical protein
LHQRRAHADDQVAGAKLVECLEEGSLRGCEDEFEHDPDRVEAALAG